MGVRVKGLTPEQTTLGFAKKEKEKEYFSPS